MDFWERIIVLALFSHTILVNLLIIRNVVSILQLIFSLNSVRVDMFLVPTVI